MLSLDKVQKSLLDFCISLLNNPIETNENDCSLVIALAVLGVTKKGFQGPKTYSSQLSAILKISRFFVLRFSYESSTSSLNTNIDSDDSKDSEFLGLDLGQQSLDRLTSMVNQFMIRGTHTSMDWLLDLRAYEMNIARNTTSIGQMD